MNKIKILRLAKTSLGILFLFGAISSACSTVPLQRINIAPTSIQFDHIIIDRQGPSDLWQKTVGDLNDDGLLDLIAGGRTSGGLVWYENPNWTRHGIAASGEFGTDAEVADVDRDGDNDIISLTTSEIIWYENPDWTPHNIENRVLHDLEIADFDCDGDIDIVARNQGEFGQRGDKLHFYQQNSPISWTHREVNIANGEGLKVVNIDDDKDPDVVAGGSWFENSGDIVNGPWTEYAYAMSWSHPNTFVSAGDINGDGRVDIALSPSELAGQTYHISWFEAPPDPKSDGWTEHIVENNVEAVHHFIGIADMDNDGDQDIASAEMNQGKNPDEVKIYFNDDGQGQSWIKEVVAETGSHSMRILDFDNDGDIDLYGANWQGQQVEMWENQSCPSNLDSWQRHLVDSNKPWRSIFITSADVDGDEWQDIITGGWWYKNPGSSNGAWVRNAFGSSLNNMAAIYDFNEDGNIDVLGTSGKGAEANSSFVWALNNGAGAFTIIDNIESGDGDFLQGVSVGNFLNGQNLEVALSWHTDSKGIQTLTVPSDPLSGTWTWSQLSTTSQDEALSIGDIDSDGDLDLLLGTLWLENYGTSWKEHILHETSGAPYGESDPDRNRLADINRDGRLDAVVGFEAISVSGKLAWYEQGQDATSIWGEHVIANVVGPMSLDVADIDRDGDLDVILGEHNLEDPASAKLYIFENEDGRGNQWKEHVVYIGDEHHDGTQTVDIDGDGDLDIISIGWGHDDVILYENTNANCIGNK